MLEYAIIIAVVIVIAMVIKLIAYAIHWRYDWHDQRFIDFVAGFEHGHHDVVSDAESACLKPIEYYMEQAYKLPYGPYKHGVTRGIQSAFNSM